MREIKAPSRWSKHPGELAIFLGGSIENDTAESWQDVVVEQLVDYDNLIVLNPRRDNWDSSWVQSIKNIDFREQVEWELHGQERADINAYYFDPNTKSPITLLELGRYFGKQDLIVCCPEKYRYSGNVEIFCKWESIPLVSTFPDFISQIKAKLNKLLK